MTYKLVTHTVTIADEDTASTVADLGSSGEVVGVETNGGWDSADCGFEGSNDNTTFETCLDGSGNAISIAAAKLSTTNGWAFELTQPIRGYRYVRAKASAAQNGGPRTLRIKAFQNKAGAATATGIDAIVA